MAEPLSREGVIPVMEDAVHLLRQAPLSTLVCHWIGSAPFALLVLWLWNDLTNPRTQDATGAAEAFALALMLAWMNCWRAVFAGSLRRQLSGAPDTPWTARRIWRLAASQAFFGATKLIAIPVASLTVFPLAYAIAFYRNVAVLAGHQDLEPGELLAKARKLAAVQSAQSWALLAPLAFLYLITFVNVGVVLAAMPQIVRMISGYETAFSRSGVYFAMNPLFFLLVIAVSWLAFDPFIQAVYCVRCFRGESLETGEDLRAALRRVRAGVQAAGTALILIVLAGSCQAAVAPRDLEKSVLQNMQSHEYDWRLPPPPGGPSESSWVVRVADRLVAGMKAVARAVGRVLDRLLHWLSGQRVPMPQGGSPPPVAGLNRSLYVISGAVLVLALAILWRKRKSLVRRPASVVASPAAVVRLDAEEISPDHLPEERWLELASKCLREENLRLALRALYLANLAWLGRCQWLTIDAGKTNREYELELKRRVRELPEARTLFGGNIAAFERAWYGQHEVRLEDIEEFRGRMGRMKSILAPA